MNTETQTEATVTKTFTALYGHDSMETAYMVNDYPYGSMRCRIRFWIERNNKGCRFVSQTENPKNLRWNAPKKSTYVPVSMNLYLDEKGHCVHAVVAGNESPAQVRSYLERFPMTPDAKMVKALALKAAAYANVTRQGKALYVINGEPCMPSEKQVTEAASDYDAWAAIVKAL